MKLKYDNYTFELMPTVAIDIKPLKDSNNAQIGCIEIWKITGSLLANSQSELASKISALESAFQGNNNKAVYIYYDDDSVARQINTTSTSGVIQGAVIEGPSYQQSEGIEFLTIRTFEINIETKYFITGHTSDKIYEQTQKIAYTYDANDKIQRNISGTLKTIPGNALTQAQTIISNTSIQSGYQRIQKQIEQNIDNSESSYSFTDIQYWKALPSNVGEGSYTESTAIDQNNRISINISGSFKGTGALSAANVLKKNDLYVVSESITENDYDGSVSFSYQYLDLSALGSVISHIQTIKYKPARKHIVEKRYMNEPPRLEETGLDFCEIVESGTIVGKNNYPSLPSAKYNKQYIVSEDWEYQAKEKYGNAYILCPLSYTRIYKSPINLSIEYPTRI